MALSSPPQLTCASRVRARAVDVDLVLGHFDPVEFSRVSPPCRKRRAAGDDLAASNSRRRATSSRDEAAVQAYLAQGCWNDLAPPTPAELNQAVESLHLLQPKAGDLVWSDMEYMFSEAHRPAADTADEPEATSAPSPAEDEAHRTREAKRQRFVTSATDDEIVATILAHDALISFPKLEGAPAMNAKLHRAASVVVLGYVSWDTVSEMVGEAAFATKLRELTAPDAKSSKLKAPTLYDDHLNRRSSSCISGLQPALIEDAPTRPAPPVAAC